MLIATCTSLDLQAKEIRVFDHNGAYLRTYGRRGEGSGELASPEAVAVLSDGRVLVRDPGKRHVQVFAADGRPADEWPIVNPAFGTSAPLWVGAADRTLVVTRQQVDVMVAETIVIAVDRDGTILDDSDFKR